MKKLIPADTVDAKGAVWETTGENIRNGAKEFSKTDIETIANLLFPVGSVYCGENSFILSVGKWNQITENSAQPLVLGTTSISGTAANFAISGNSDGHQTIVRMWKRVS